ncbi:Uncharacterised protein [Zhongshania aliphaticivorans]|uniref:Uncharacterized protein n=1 Tax=Zhongshania aliphaticivorans TaxID=1470434 RepID=A0A5S9MZK1_9GAMM|nr:hypothetical protein [Zhongshania aliphaticivorans]CAA0081714.1 Uncharacterised protein [Zhongshania aliphaticivorans]CAA0084801.1 Uncharacterised protein [Zhongshania aliphaticivorans]
MGDVLPFKRKSVKPKASTTLCREGFHKWRVDKAKQFDVKQGKLVTVFVCERCGEKKITAQ